MNKGLEALKDIKQLLSLNQYGGDKDKQVVNDELYTIKKELKTLEIIKSEFEISFNDKEQTIQFESIEEPYTHIRFSLTREIKDKEKYDLLKEVLE